MDNYNYPLGADNSSAPWNRKENPEKEIEVCVSITLSKTVKIKVSDYNILSKEISEDGSYYEDIDYSSCDLKAAVEDQIVLPHCASNLLEVYKVDTKLNKSVIDDLKDWSVDDYEVILSTAKMLFDANYDGRAVRLLGVSLNNTIDKKDYKEQLSIFDSNHDKTNEDNDLDVILDDINKKFEKPIVTKASKIKNKSIQKKYLK